MNLPGSLQKTMKSGKVSAEDFYSSYGKTLHVLSDEYKGYLKDDETAAANHIYQKDGAKDGQAEIAIAGNLTLTEEGYTLGKYDETGDLSQMLSEQIFKCDDRSGCTLFESGIQHQQ